MNDLVSVAKVNDENFQKQVIESSLPVIVVFEKSCWGTTHIMKPILDKIASDYSGMIKVFKYNLEENSITAAYYRIEDSTTILLFNEGSVIYKTGVISKEEIKKIIHSFLIDRHNP
jgi:thioredoxin 1